MKTELERMKKENDVYRHFNKSSGNNQSAEILQKLIEKSQREYVDLKNIQLKRVERQEETKQKP